MILKKTIDDIQCYFEIKRNVIILEQEEILIDIIKSLNYFKFINKSKPFNELIKEQQKNKKYIMVDFNSKPIDEFKFIYRAVFNFLTETDQTTNFDIDRIIFPFNNDEIILYGLEQFFMFDEHGYKINLPNDISFSPTIRSCWVTDPELSEKIILRS